jgi:galactokinase
MHSAAPGPSFGDLFTSAADGVADAPGRVNLIGEHTDYHEGFVLPTVIPQRTSIEGRRRPDALVRVWSRHVCEQITEYAVGAEQSGRGWLDYVQGVTAMLARRGHHVGGVDLLIRSDVPVGAGLSSSAALEVALLRLLRQLWALEVDDVAIARLAQAVETNFVGAPVGIMDPMACSLGAEREVLFLDTRSLAYDRIPLPAAVEIAVIDSGEAHTHASGGYATRRDESFAAAAALGVAYLRDAEVGAIISAELSPVLARRARHVITENRRVADTVAALRHGDADAAGVLMNASHASMRDDYEISTPEIDALVSLAQSHPDVYGARMTGGGFGGAIVMLTRAGAAADAARWVSGAYEAATARPVQVVVPPRL